MSKVEFSKPEKEAILQKIQDYFATELDRELGQFEAEFLIDFICKEIGGYFYNRGLYDAQTILETRLDDISEAILQLEQPTDFAR